MKLQLQHLRESRGITQTFISKRLGFKSVSAYSSIEKEESKLDIVRAKEIADIFGVQMEQLFFENDLDEKTKSA
jgi:putative transcriptional regulator